MRITPYLNFDGTCAEAFRFYQEVLGGQLNVMTHGESPIAGEVPPDWHGRVLHANLAVGDQLLMASDTPPGTKSSVGTCVCLEIDEIGEAERAFGRLAEGGTVTMPFEKTFWAERFGMVTDRFGTSWMLNCQIAQL